jgi:hypothetical protein
MKIQLAKLKAELKVLTSTIRTVKFNTRHDQSDFDKKYPQRHVWEQRKLLNKNEEFNQQQKEVWTNYSNLSNAYEEFRAKHIAYCLLRGRTMEQIEPKLRDPNYYIHKRVRDHAVSIVKTILEAVNAQAETIQS